MAKLNVKTFKNLGEAQARYVQEVDAAAEKQRSQYITASPGQSMTYEAKYEEALRYINHGSSDALVWLPQEAEALGSDIDTVAQGILSARKTWEVLGAQIEAARLKAKQQIRQAATPAEMYGAVQALQSVLTDLSK